MPLSANYAEPPPDKLLASILAGDQAPLETLYLNHRPAFLEWARGRFPELPDDDLADAFQEGIILFYEQIVSGYLTSLTAAPRTYIFRLSERICHKAKKSLVGPINVLPVFDINSRDDPDSPPEILPDHLIETDPYELAEANEERDALVARALQQLSPDCARLLIGYYYQGLSLTALSDAFDHRDHTVTIVRKSQCLTKLRALCGALRR